MQKEIRMNINKLKQIFLLGDWGVSMTSQCIIFLENVIKQDEKKKNSPDLEFHPVLHFECAIKLFYIVYLKIVSLKINAYKLY